MDVSSFARLLRHHRLGRGLTQEELAERARLSARAVSDLERGLKRAPRASTVRLLAEALELSADQAAALLAVAQRGNPESVAERIRTIGESQRPTAPGPRGGPLPPGLFEGPLVGRAAEFARLVELYRAAGAGQTQVVVLGGEPGIGKTRLAREFLAWATDQGADILQGRAFETGGRLPYQPLVDALRPRLEREAAPEDLLTDLWLAELGRLLPELRDRYPDLPAAAGDGEEGAARMRLFEAIARLGLALAQRSPAVLFVDDVQWADAGSLDGLLYVGRRWTEGQAPLLVLLSLRPEALAATPVLDEWLSNGLPRAVTLTQVELGPLSSEDTLRFVQGVADEAEPAEIDELARWLYAETGGQPLFVVETLRALLEREALVPRPRETGGWAIDLPGGLPDAAALASTLPPGVREVIHARLAHLLPAAREVLAAGSVLGQSFTFEQLRRVAGLAEDEALLATDEVVRRHLLREAGTDNGALGAGAYLFAHDKIRDVVYAEAGDARRRVFHRRALEALEGTAPAAKLAHHALAAGLDEPAVRFGLAAGEEAVRLLAARDAIPHYERALEIAERRGWRREVAVLHARCGKALANLTRWVDARRELEVALECVGADESELRAQVLIDLLEVYWWCLDVPTLHRRAAEAVTLAENLDRADLRSAAVTWLVPIIAAEGDVAGCVVQGAQAFARGRELGFEPPPPVQAYMSVPLYWLGRIEEAVERSRESVRAAREANHTSATMFALPNLGMTLAASGRYVEAAGVFEEARRFGHEHGIGTMLARAIAMSAGYHLDVLDFATNEALAEEARELARSLSFTPPVVSAGLDLMVNFARRQEVDRAEALIAYVAESADKATAWHGWLWNLRLNEARAEIALARGNWEEALRWSAVAIKESRERGRVKYRVLGLRTRAEALRRLGRVREAIPDLRSAVALARPVGDPALFLRAATGLLAVDGNDALAAEASTTAERIARALPDARMRGCFEAALPYGVLGTRNARVTW